MKISLEIELQPFTVPNYVIQVVPPGRREEGMKESPKYALSELDSDTLDALCREFRNAVFVKAGKPQPPMPG